MRRLRAQHEFEQLIDRLKGRHLCEPPDGLLRRAISLGSVVDRQRSIGQWLVERIFDSAVELIPAGVRGDDRLGERRLLFQARPPSQRLPLRHVDLRLRREPGGAVELTGQILPPPAAATVVVTGGRVRRSAAVSKAGEFLFRGVAGSATTLLIEVKGIARCDLVIADIPVPERVRF